MVKLVILEDDRFFGRMYADKFEQAGYDIHIATNGEDALAQIKKDPPTLVLSDIMVPGMTGLELLKHLKADKKLAKIPFVFLTNVSRSDDDIQHGLELGAIGYLVKSSMSPEEIVARVKEYIEAYAPSRDLPEHANERLKRAKKLA